jgi:hypothetical protein
MKPISAEDVWLEGADAPPSFASRAAVVGVVLCCFFGVFFLIGHATAGGGAEAEQPAGTVVGTAQATVPDGLGAVAALGALEAARPLPARSHPAPSAASEVPVQASRPAPALEPEPVNPSPEPAPAHVSPAPAAKPAPAPSSSGSHGGAASGGGGSSFDSSG